MLDLDLIVHVCIQAIFSKILLKYLTLILYSYNMCITIILSWERTISGSIACHS